MRYFQSAAFALAVTALVAFGVTPRSAMAENLTVTRATLSNGLRVVVVRDPLAPVVTTMLNYQVGSDDQWIAGLAHATEHMMFRGSKTVSSSQLMDTLSITGGNFDADTQNQITQYFFTVPSQYLDIALRLERSRATGLLMSPKGWAAERGAIEQEVTQDHSDAIMRLFMKMQKRLVAGTPYAKDGLGTLKSFNTQVNSTQLLKFYHTWYHPNNAIFVIVGDVNGKKTIAEVSKLFGAIPKAKLPAREPVHLRPIKPIIYRQTSDKPYTIVLRGYRLPGFESKEYAAGQILGDVLSNSRSSLGALAAHGKILGSGFQGQSLPKISLGLLYTVVGITVKPEAADALTLNAVAAYVKTGLPADLVAAAKRREIAQLEFNGNSIEGLAFQWSQAVAVQGLRSPNDMIAQFKHVTLADVNRVMREYLVPSKSVVAYAVPKNTGKMSMGGGGMAKENNSIPPSHHQPLPIWAQRVLDHLKVPLKSIAPVSMMLPNGIRLIVQPESVTHTVVVSGEILNNPQVQEPAGKDGVNDVLSALFPYGTTTLNRIAFQKAQDDIAATVNVGTSFGLQVLSKDFDRGVQLLADDELHPALPPKAFMIAKAQQVAQLNGAANAPDHLAQVALANALYPIGYPLRRFATPTDVRALTLTDVKAWYASAYRPDLTTIVVVGDITPAAAKTSIEKYFGAWSAVGAKPQVYPPPVALNGSAQVVVPATGRVQSSVRMEELIGVKRIDPDYAALQLANTALTGGFYSSLLYHDLREVHGYVYYIGSDFALGKVVSDFSLRYGSDPKNIVPAQNQILANLHHLQTKPLVAYRLLRAKAMLMGDVPLRQDSYNGLSNLLLDYAVRGLSLDQGRVDAKAELSTTAAQVQAALAKWVRPNAFVRVVTGPGPQ